MNHCRACNTLLSDREAARTYPDFADEIGLCDPCYEITFGYDTLISEDRDVLTQVPLMETNDDEHD
jgi:hypothetical protein